MTAFGDVLPEAVVIAISPIPLVLVILMLVSDRARTNGPGFVVGWVAGVADLVLVVFAVSDSAEVSADPTAADGGSPVQVAPELVFARIGLAITA